MSNLLKPSVDQIVFANRNSKDASRSRQQPEANVSFLGQDEDGEPVVKRLAGLIRSLVTAAVLVAGFAIERIGTA